MYPDVTLFWCALTATGITFGLLAFERACAPRWALRGMPLGTRPVTAALRAGTGIAGGIAVGHAQTGGLRVALAVSLAGAALSWLLLLASATDLRFRKVPFEACWTVTGLGMVAAALCATSSAAAGLAGGELVVALVYLLAHLTRGAGRGDLRLIAAAAATLSWWAGVSGLLTALSCACLAQLVLRLVAAAGRARSGQLAHALAGLGGAPAGPIRGKRVYPMAPGIAVGVLLAAVVAVHSGFHPCHDWTGALAAACPTTGG